MNNQEAIDTNTLLGWMLRLVEERRIREVDARDAAVRLAHRANLTLHAGITGPAVSNGWRFTKIRRAFDPPPKKLPPKKKPDGGPAR